MNGLDMVIAVITGLSVLCSLPFIKPLYQAYRRAQMYQLTQSMARVNEPMVSAYKKQLALIKNEIDTTGFTVKSASNKSGSFNWVSNI